LIEAKPAATIRDRLKVFEDLFFFLNSGLSISQSGICKNQIRGHILHLMQEFAKNG